MVETTHGDSEPASYPTARRAAPDSQPAAQSRWHVLGVFILMLVSLHLVAGPRLHISTWHVPADSNPAMLEAKAWSQGRLDLNLPPEADASSTGRLWDTALVDGKAYNVYPPLFTLICWAATKLYALSVAMDNQLVGLGDFQFYAPWYVAMVALPLPFVGFWAFQKVLRRAEWAAVLTVYWLAGTPLLWMLWDCRDCSLGAVNHVLSSVGLMLIAGDLLGRRRIWPSALGLLIGMWTRQLTAFYIVAIALVILKTSAARRRDLVLVGLFAAVGAGVLGGLNWAKFGSPFDTGYMAIYKGRSDLYAARAEHGLFDVRYMPRNLYYMNASVPEVQLSQMKLQIVGDPDGTSIWLTSPLLLAGLWGVGYWWRDPARRALMLASLLVIFGFLCYHTTGSVQCGYYRFALDFVPVWLVVIAPWVVEGRRRFVTLGCLAWSLLYFRLLPA